MPTNNSLRGPILLITDLSPRCDRAMDRAAALSSALNLPLIALHVMDTPWLTRLTQPAWESLQQQNIDIANRRLRHELAPAGIELTVLVEAGNPVEVIEQVSRANPCSLIVSGTARDETLGRIVLGNTVERLSHRTSVPMLVVRARPIKPYSKVMVATDFSSGASQALVTTQALCPEAQMTIYHAFDQVAGIYELDAPTIKEQIQTLRNKAKAFAHSSLASDSLDLPVVVEHGEAEQCLPAYVDRHDTELVAMGTHGATGLVHTAMGSVAEKLLARLRCDVLIVPQLKR